MQDTYVFILTGDTGTGKTATMLAYHPKHNLTPRRIVVDQEFRASHYQSPAGIDEPDKLLFNFQIFPEGGEMNITSWLRLVDMVKTKQMDVLAFDNMALLQEEIEGWCQDAAGTKRFLASVGDDSKHEMFLKFRFTQDQYWRKAIQGAMRTFLILCKQNGVDVIITTETQNKWQNYGVRGMADDGKPNARIIGKQAKIWERTLQMGDVNWFLKRTVNGKIQGAPMVGIDPLRPKMSIVGIPPEFQFQNWSAVWDYSVKREVPSDKDLAKIEMPVVEYNEPDAQAETVAEDKPVAAKVDFIREAVKLGFTDDKKMKAVLEPLSLWPYSAENHAAMVAALKEAKK